MGSLGGQKELSRQRSSAIAPVSREHSELAAGHGSALGSAPPTGQPGVGDGRWGRGSSGVGSMLAEQGEL